jgi:AcrR family transcriptional regulator
MTAPTTEPGKRRQLQDAAIGLFERLGYDAVTVDDIVQAAGVSRRTYFRYFATKEDSALGDHDDRAAAFRRLLQDGRQGELGPVDHVIESARIVLLDIWADPGFYRRRYRLVFTTPALRDRMHVTDRAFTEPLTEAIGPSFPASPLGALAARMLAAAGIELVNAVLEQWALDPALDGDQLFTQGAAALARAAAAWTDPRQQQAHVVLVARTDLSPAEIRLRLNGFNQDRS